MKNILLMASIASTVAGNAFAGSVATTYVPEPVVVAENVETGWSGLYLGGKYSNTFDGTQGYYFNDSFTSNREMGGEMYGGFIGYNFQRNNMVYGLELAYATGDINRSDGGGRPDNTHTYLADAKLRAGYSFGRTLVFGTLGLAASNWQENTRGDASTMGISYGVGVDFKIWKELFIGAEYVHRDLTSEKFPWSGSDEYFESSLNTVEVRLGWNF